MEVVDGMIFLAVRSDADLRGPYDPTTGAWAGSGESEFSDGTLRETIEGMWLNEGGAMVLRGTLTYEFVPGDGSETCTGTYSVEYRPH